MADRTERLEDYIGLPMPGDDNFHLTIKFLLDRIYALQVGLHQANNALRRNGIALLPPDADEALEQTLRGHVSAREGLKNRWDEMFDPDVPSH